MFNPAGEFAAVVAEYDQQWLEHVARLGRRLQLLRTAKQGMELLLLVGSYLLYYFLDCFAQILALPLPLGR